MTVKWSKQLCIEYSQQMKSKLEEITGTSNNQNPLQKVADRLRQMVSKKP